MKSIVAVVFAFAMTAGVLCAGEKKLMHCFTFTTIEQATPADWDAFRSATAELPKKIPGLTKVWSGKLSRPMRTPGGTRTYGVCMEFDDQAALEKYAADPAHKKWQEAYEKVRQPGTTTFDLLGE
jgi:antibiotic biosynthesis monooxygenase (ABM) superfamily enzyme